MSGAWQIDDLGTRRVLTVDGQRYETGYSTRVLRMLIERKGIARTPPYLRYKDTRGPHFLGPLFRYIRARGWHGLTTLEVGCSFGHMTEYLAEQPEIAAIHTFDADPAFVEMTRTKVAELHLAPVREVRRLAGDDTVRLPYADGQFALVVVVGVVEHLPMRHRRAQVDEYYRVLAPGGLIVVLDTPNRLFPLETHSIGLPLVQWLPAPLAYRYAQTFRRRRYGHVTFAGFTADGTGWRNATLRECLPSTGMADLDDLTEEAGYGWRFFRDTARSRTRRALLPVFAVICRALAAVGQPPSLALPYLNLMFRKRPIALDAGTGPTGRSTAR